MFLVIASAPCLDAEYAAKALFAVHKDAPTRFGRSELSYTGRVGGFCRRWGASFAIFFLPGWMDLTIIPTLNHAGSNRTDYNPQSTPVWNGAESNCPDPRNAERSAFPTVSAISPTAQTLYRHDNFVCTDRFRRVGLVDQRPSSNRDVDLSPGLSLLITASRKLAKA